MAHLLRDLTKMQDNLKEHKLGRKNEGTDK